MKRFEEDEVVNTTTRDCAFCGGRVTLGDDAQTGNGVLLHTMPPCPKFVALEPEEFVRQLTHAERDG